VRFLLVHIRAKKRFDVLVEKERAQGERLNVLGRKESSPARLWESPPLNFIPDSRDKKRRALEEARRLCEVLSDRRPHQSVRLDVSVVRDTGVQG